MRQLEEAEDLFLSRFFISEEFFDFFFDFFLCVEKFVEKERHE